MTYISFSQPSAVIILDPLTTFISSYDTFPTQKIESCSHNLAKRYPYHSEAFCLNKAYAAFFSIHALDLFEELVQKVSRQFQVIIVLTSKWGRSVSSVEELQEFLPQQYSFKAYVIDALQLAPDFVATQSMLVTEGQLMAHWLFENAETRQIRRFIILGHFDEKEEVHARFERHSGFIDPSRSVTEVDMQSVYLNIIHQDDFQVSSLISNKEVKQKRDSEEKVPCVLL